MLQLVDSSGPAGARLGEELIELRAQIDRLELRFSELAASFGETLCWDYEGFNSALDWLRFNCRMTSAGAADRLAVGERLGELKQSTQAMEEGVIGFAHVAVMARTANAVRGDFDEAKLLPLAKENTPGRFHYKCMHYRHSVNAQDYAAEQAELVENRRLKLSTAQDGCLLISGILDPVGGAVVRTALEPLAKPTGAGDDRNAERRYGDAIVEFASGRQHVAMQVTAPLETLLALVGAPGAENEFTLPISAKTVERWACDCSLTRVLMQDSVVIDVGRAERTIRGPRRRALIARDRHCQWPGCERPASMCEGHHLQHWLHGGGGEIENQLLLCTRHHYKVHESGWQLVKTADGRTMAIAPVVTFGPPQRGPAACRTPDD
ncbi:MAG TPA: DUF222 domain-containing protein [Candidatus Dormibacteraeota bacterium]|nr:DUF222 domain-containing protein [Candidatus Dormibacteraeota bacterium]